ncbi:MAG: trypsin-like serine protease, partial [Microbacterium gubbeenense]|uniref:trypsin-like serine protease n=1 Tax=Microbacterium gubbeenense TaxID=159896 RepID=UPI003F944059
VAPAAADDAPAPTTTVEELAPQALAIPGVVGVTTDGIDIFIKVDDSADGSGGMQANAKSADVTSQANALAAQFAGVKVVEGTIMEATSSDEVVGGAGIAMPDFTTGSVGVCSVGFNAWSPEGKPAVLTAGHCVADILDVFTSVPSGDGAAGSDQIALMAELGTFGFNQFGLGSGQTNEADGTDIAVIDNINPDLTLLPAVTNWGTEAAASDDLAADAVPVTNVTEAQIGDHMFRSGRTSGAYSGTVVERGVQVIQDHDGNRLPVFGFQALADDTSVDFGQGGDSGGSAIRDDGAALGLLSGSPGPGQPGDETAWFADLPHALDVIRENAGDYQLMIDIAEPTVTTAQAERGGVFEGTAPANADVAISGDIEATVPADENGNFSFPAPDEVGSFDITLQATQGFNISDKVNATVKTSEIQVDAPAITSPGNESSSTSAVTEVTGTGMPGATVELQGDAEGTAKVNENGNWSIATELGFGAYTVGATQSVSGVTSEARWVSFQVVPGAPTLVTPQDGATLDEGQLTAVVGESPIAGADVKVVVEGADGVVARGSATVDGGSWMAELSDALVPGAYTVKATQSIDGVSSSSVSASFEVVAAAGGGGGGEEPTEAPTAAPSETPGPGGLAPTGADTASVVAPFAGGAAVILLAGITLLVIRRVKSA